MRTGGVNFNCTQGIVSFTIGDDTVSFELFKDKPMMEAEEVNMIDFAENFGKDVYEEMIMDGIYDLKALLLSWMMIMKLRECLA